MIVTEQQALDLWCPQTGGEHEHLACMGSKCMAWHWLDGPDRKFRMALNTRAIQEPSRSASHIPDGWTWVPFDENAGEPAGWLEPEADADARRRGRCGLVHP